MCWHPMLDNQVPPSFETNSFTSWGISTPQDVRCELQPPTIISQTTPNTLCSRSRWRKAILYVHHTR